MPTKHYLLVLSLIAFGCSGGVKTPDRPATHPVSGTVTYQGTPLAGATVTFRPALPGGRGAVGVTDETGVYKLMTFETADGAIAGNYIATVVKQETTPGDQSYNDTESPNYGKEPPPEALGKTTDLIPAKFGDVTKSGLNVTVKEGENDIPLTLAD